MSLVSVVVVVLGAGERATFLPPESEPQGRAANFHMAVSHRRQTVRLICARILYIADANMCRIEQVNDCCQDFVTW